MIKRAFRFGYSADFFYLGIILIIFGLGLPSALNIIIFAFVIVYLRVDDYTEFFNKKAVWLFLFSISYVYIDAGEQINFGPIRSFDFIFSIVFSYLVGKKIFDLCQNNRNKAIVLFCILQLAIMTVGSLAVLRTYRIDPLMFNLRRFISLFSDYEMHALYMAASFQVAMAMMPFLLYWLYTARKVLPTYEKTVYVIMVIGGLLGVWINNILQNRSPYAVMLFMLLLPVFILPKKISGISNVRYGAFIFIVLVLGGIVFFGMGFTTDQLLSEGFASRLESEEMDTNGRYDVWVLALQLIPQHPFGGIVFPRGYEGTEGYFHNFWFDVARVSGFIPLFFIVAFQLAHMRKVYLVFTSGFSLEKIFLIVNIFCILFYYFTEPILELMPLFFFYSIMLLGYVSKYEDAGRMASNSVDNSMGVRLPGKVKQISYQRNCTNWK